MNTKTEEQPLIKPASDETAADSKDPTERLSTLKALYNPIKAFPLELDHAAKKFSERFEVEEDYNNPFHECSKHTDLVREIRNKLTDFATEQIMTDYPNVTVDNAKLIKHMDEKEGELGFNVHTIYRYLKENYLDNIKTLSLKEITDKAKELVPHYINTGDGYNTRPATVEDILKGNKLILRAYFNTSYDGKPYIHDVTGKITALEKLIYIALHDTDPATIRRSEISTFYWNMYRDNTKTPGDFYRKHELHNDIKTIRLYKNNRLDVELASHEDALKVAKILLGE